MNCDVCGAEPGRCMTETICRQTRERVARESNDKGMPTPGDDRLREIAHRHARHAVMPGNTIGPGGFDPVAAQNVKRAEEVIFHALKDAFREHASATRDITLDGWTGETVLSPVRFAPDTFGVEVRFKSEEQAAAFRDSLHAARSDRG